MRRRHGQIRRTLRLNLKKIYIQRSLVLGQGSIFGGIFSGPLATQNETPWGMILFKRGVLGETREH